MTTRTIPHTRRRGSFDSRPILWILTFALAAWVVVYLFAQALAGIVGAALSLLGAGL